MIIIVKLQKKYSSLIGLSTSIVRDCKYKPMVTFLLQFFCSVFNYYNYHKLRIVYKRQDNTYFEIEVQTSLLLLCVANQCLWQHFTTVLSPIEHEL